MKTDPTQKELQQNINRIAFQSNQKKQFVNDDNNDFKDQFIHPYALIQKQNALFPKISESIPIEAVPSNVLESKQQQNYTDLLSLSKTKLISKPLASMSPSVIPSKHYRTKMCPEGLDCKRRMTCQFAHSQYELRKPYKNRKQPCIRYQKGLCNLGATCNDYHGNIDLKKNYKYKQSICKSYQQGKCKKGELCIFIHEQRKQQYIQDQADEQILQQQLQKEQNQYQQPSNSLNVNINQSIHENKDIFSKKDSKIVKPMEVVETFIQKNQETNKQKEEQMNFDIEFNFN